MTNFTSSLERLSAAATPAEYLAAQSACLANANEEEVIRISQTTEPGSAGRLDSLQILYWLISPDDRVARFQRMVEEAGDQEADFLKALLFRAITERAVRSSYPERVDPYLNSVREQFAKSLFAS